MPDPQLSARDPLRAESSIETTPRLASDPASAGGPPAGGLADPMPLAELVAARATLGPISHLDLTSREVIPAHHDLGEEVAEQVHRHLRVKIAALEADRLSGEVRAARQCRAATLERVRSPSLDARIRSALQTYLDSLAAWTEGARLDDFARTELAGVAVDGAPLRGDDLAFVLQMETIGCQTGLLRTPEGSVILWHTEEDRAQQGYSRFDRLRVVSFRWAGSSPPRVVTGFLYPDLLLGPAFGWSGDSYVQAVDSFYLDPASHLAGVPANAITWVCLLLAGERSTTEIARQLAPSHNGYALASARRHAGAVAAETTEFVDHAIVRTELAEQAGASHFQVNLLSSWGRLSVPGRERVEAGIEPTLQRRQIRARRALNLVSQQADGLASCARLLASRVGGAACNANPDVKAHFLCHLTAEGASFWVGPGPAIRQGSLLADSWSPPK